MPKKKVNDVKAEIKKIVKKKKRKVYFGQEVQDAIVEYNSSLSSTEKNEFEINPDGGYKHFGNVNGDYIIVKGSVPGTYRRLIKLRKQIRNEPKKILKPNILEVVLP